MTDKRFRTIAGLCAAAALAAGLAWSKPAMAQATKPFMSASGRSPEDGAR